MSNKKWAIGVAVILLLSLGLAGIFNVQTPAMAAPMAAPTPAGIARAVEVPSQGTLWDAKRLTADTRSNCINTSRYEKMDLIYTIDQTIVAGAANTTTLTLHFTNRTPGAAGTTYAVGAALVTANNADVAATLLQVPVFGAWTCVYADVTTALPLTVTLDALLK
jgi:hypothetical protein